MNNILHRNIVLVLNRNWQAIDTTTPAGVFGQMATDAATGLDIRGTDWMVPIRWNDWLDLPVREEDFSIGTARGRVRVPTVVVLSRFDRVPMRRPKFSLRGLWLRNEPVRPREMPATWFIRNTFGIPDWEVFLPRKSQQSDDKERNQPIPCRGPNRRAAGNFHCGKTRNQSL